MYHPQKRMPELPVEVLREIFSYLPSTLQVHRAHQFPWHLGQVCSIWRALFFSMHSTFWRNIEIQWEYDWLRPIRFSERLKALLAFFLNRTQGSPFSFSLFRERSYPEKKVVRWILKDLLDHSRQWEEVSILLQSADFHLFRNAKGHLPLLKRLDIMFLYPVCAIHPSITGIFQDAPLLTHVVVGDMAMLEFNWSSLTILGIGCQDRPTKFLSNLQKTVNLVELRIGMDFYSHMVESSGMIHLSHLEYLSIQEVQLLTVLETPALRRLEILSYPNLSVSSVVDNDKTADFLCRSRLKLTFAEVPKWHGKVVLHTSPI